MAKQAKYEFVNHIPDLVSKLPSEVESRTHAAALYVETKVKENLAGQRSGNIYRVPATNKTWQASAPYDFPAVRLGELRRTYKGFTKGTGFYTEGFVASPMDYAPHLEYGTKKMAMRPHLRKTAHYALPEISKNFVGLL